MNLRNKTLLAIGITFTCFFVFMTVIILPMTLSELGRLEYQDSLQGVLQTKAVIDTEMTSLQITAHDWSWWDDMDQYVQGRNPEFATANLDPESIATLHVNLVVITDKNGDVVFSRLLSPDFKTEAPVSDATLHLVLGNPSVTNLSGPAEGVSGILLVPEGPMILTSSHILPSSKEGSPDGAFIIGRYLQSGVLSKVSEVTSSPVNVYTDTDTTLVQMEQAALSEQSGDSTIFVVPHNESTISGVISLTDFNGKKVLVVTELPRDVYHSGLAIIYQFFILFCLSAIVVAVVVSWVMDRTVLQPLARLSAGIQDYEKNADNIQVPVLMSNDEFAQLEKTIITSNKKLTESEKRFRDLAEQFPEMISEADIHGVPTFINRYTYEVLGYSEEDFRKGFTLFDLVVSEDQQRIRQNFAKLLNGETLRGNEYTALKKDGTRFPVILYSAPIVSHGKITGIRVFAGDITEQKRADAALQQATRKLSLLNQITFNDIQNVIFTLGGYTTLAKSNPTDEKLGEYLEKEKELVRKITLSLKFAQSYQDIGKKPARWQNVLQSFLYAISHLDFPIISRKLDVDNLEIYADPLLESVFFILAENVIRHGKTATEISFRYHESGGDLILVFEDNGPGIAPDRKEKIFERDYKERGGPNLFLAREILSITGVTIRETGEPGKGARFEMTVPKGAWRMGEANRKGD